MIKNTRTKNQQKLSRPAGDFFSTKKAWLILEDGKKFEGVAPAWQDDSLAAEVVFNTGMTGYVESLTDPSYSNQILTFTYPLIGNYGVHLDKWESEKIHTRGVVVSNLVNNYSHPKASYSFLEWLQNQNVPLIDKVDTRALTTHLRTKGVVNGIITDSYKKIGKLSVDKPNVSIDSPKLYKTNGAAKTVVLLDCGAKENIVRSLQAKKLNVLRVPAEYDFVENDKFDGVMLSNGPGDPEDYPKSINLIKKCMKKNVPIFGICLGNQLLALASGAKTYKLKFGHRGHNQPCMDLTTRRCYITSQNHGYSVDGKSLPNDWNIYFSNLNDNSVEGIIHKSKPFFSVQFHPEACPGPTDVSWLFDKFVGTL